MVPPSNCVHISQRTVTSVFISDVTLEENNMAESKKVLIVDDDENQLVLLKEFFNKAGVEACCASNGIEALLKMGTHSFICMITDLNMPQMNGIVLAKKAKLLNPLMRIALCTGEDIQDIRSVVTDTGIEAVFRKPFNYLEVLSMAIENPRHTQNQ